MGPIVCATRGGEASRRTQERAVALARERGDPLIFLFVADTNFTQPANQSLAEALADELATGAAAGPCLAEPGGRAGAAYDSRQPASPFGCSEVLLGGGTYHLQAQILDETGQAVSKWIELSKNHSLSSFKLNSN